MILFDRVAGDSHRREPLAFDAHAPVTDAPEGDRSLPMTW